MKLSHLDEASRARMVDVGGKPETERTAVAEGLVRMSREAFEQVAAHAVAKGDVLAAGSAGDGHGQGDGAHRGGDGSAHSGERGMPHNLRHGQGSRPGNGHRRGQADEQDRGDPGRLAPLQSVGLEDAAFS